MPENFLEINGYFALTSYCKTIGQSNNAFSILGFFPLFNHPSYISWPFRYEEECSRSGKNAKENFTFLLFADTLAIVRPSPVFSNYIQWNLYSGDTLGTKANVP